MSEVIGDLEDLLEAIRLTAHGKAKDEETQAEHRADRILKQAQQEADQLRQEILRQGRAQAQAERRQRLAEAAQQAQSQRLKAREEILQKVWEQAEERLRTLVDSDDYATVLHQLARLAVRTLGTGDLVLAADPRGHELLSQDRLESWSAEASDALGIRVSFERAAKPADAWGGLIATRKQGKEQMDARFAVRLEIARSELRDEISRRLMKSNE
jgi:V/A-type H+-transporting ATPase subunit E